MIDKGFERLVVISGHSVTEDSYKSLGKDL
jgi:hypothetical protein